MKLENIFNVIGYVKGRNQSCRFYVENLDNSIVSPRYQNILYLWHTDHKRFFLIDPWQTTHVESSKSKIKKKNGSVIFQDDDTGLFLTCIDGRRKTHFWGWSRHLSVSSEIRRKFQRYQIRERKEQERNESTDNAIESPRDQNLLYRKPANHKEITLIDPWQTTPVEYSKLKT